MAHLVIPFAGRLREAPGDAFPTLDAKAQAGGRRVDGPLKQVEHVGVLTPKASPSDGGAARPDSPRGKKRPLD